VSEVPAAGYVVERIAAMKKPEPKCLNCGSTVVEELLIDEYNEVWCQSCFDRLPERDREGSEVRAYTSGDEE
jgi:DNA-directed RNA polymerase subunit RPC12/RpoP